MVFEILTKDERKHLWRTSRDRSLVGDHPARHQLLSRYEATVVTLEGQLVELAEAVKAAAGGGVRTLTTSYGFHDYDYYYRQVSKSNARRDVRAMQELLGRAGVILKESRDEEISV